jgi:hypothetical protein
MTEMYQQHYNTTFNDQDQYTYHQLALPHQLLQKPQRRLSFSSLLQKRPSLMGRKLSLFGRQKKPQLKVMIPSCIQEQDTKDLERTNTTMTSSSITTDEDDGPATPTSSTSPSIIYQKTVDLETRVTSIDASSDLLKDYSGKGYSNFYIKLPNGNWMVRIRDGNRKIIGTFEINGSMI